MILKPRLPLRLVVRRTWDEAVWILLACAAAYFGDRYLLDDHFDLPAVVPPLLGTALAFFIGFSNAQAYGRWWEARTIWGAIVNESRSWARECIYYVRDGEELAIARRLTYRHIAFVYALKAYLREEPPGSCDEVFRRYLDEPERTQLQGKQNKHNALLDWQSRDLQQLCDEGRIDGYRFLQLDRRITNLCDEMGKSERIRNTVFPPTYNYYTQMFVWVFIVSVTIVLVNGVGAYGILPAFVLGYVFVVTQGIGLRLLNPFEHLMSGTPLDQISRGIEITLLEMLGETDLPEPVRSVDGIYVT